MKQEKDLTKPSNNSSEQEKSQPNIKKLSWEEINKGLVEEALANLRNPKSHGKTI